MKKPSTHDRVDRNWTKGDQRFHHCLFQWFKTFDLLHNAALVTAIFSEIISSSSFVLYLLLFPLCMGFVCRDKARKNTSSCSCSGLLNFQMHRWIASFSCVWMVSRCMLPSWWASFEQLVIFGRSGPNFLASGFFGATPFWERSSDWLLWDHIVFILGHEAPVCQDDCNHY